MTELKYWLWLTLKKNITSQKITALLERFGTPEAIFYAEKDSFSGIPELQPGDLKTLESRDMRVAQAVMETCRKKHIKILTFDSPYYPSLLSQIYDPPYVLYARCRERIDLNQHLTLSMVGTRYGTDYGLQVASELAGALARAGVTVVSGMASGGDSAAHRGALFGGGLTVAVLGCGVDICYPAHNFELMESIIAQGMVLSEYPPGTPPYPQHFPERNRIISGLSYGTIVVEAPERSGALITAHRAEEQNRDLFIVPGDVTRSHSAGSNSLLFEGVKPVLSVEDVLEEYRDRFPELLQRNQPVFEKEICEERKDQREVLPADLSEKEQTVMAFLTAEPVHIDEINNCGLSASELSAALTMLEMKGLVRALPGKHFCRTL